METVYTLYRVSTKKQVDKQKDDIPMQREACRDFAERMGWNIGKEFLEKGVSGFKVSANDRDAIQDLKTAAVKGEFQILLVFMFDRIGRIDDETPFVVEWFVKHGIKVWSVQEGEQRFESHVDKLMNYIRFWQASGSQRKPQCVSRPVCSSLLQRGAIRAVPFPLGISLNDGAGSISVVKKFMTWLSIPLKPSGWYRFLRKRSRTGTVLSEWQAILIITA